MDKLLRLPSEELARLADHQRKEPLKRALGDEPAPLTVALEIGLKRPTGRWEREEIRVSSNWNPNSSSSKGPGLKEFLQDPSLSGVATAKEVEFRQLARRFGRE